MNEQTKEKINNIMENITKDENLCIVRDALELMFSQEEKDAEEQKTYYAVIRLEAQNEEDEETQNECDSFEFSSEKAEEYLKFLERNEELVNSGYIGNAYFLETTKKERIIQFATMLTNDSEGVIPPKSHITIEWDYFPDWADEITKQNEE